MTTVSTIQKHRVEISGHEPFEFNITQADFDTYTNEMQRSLSTAAYNLLHRTCTDSKRFAEAVKVQWGLPLAIVGKLSDALMGVREADLKNSSVASPS